MIKLRAIAFGIAVVSAVPATAHQDPTSRSPAVAERSGQSDFDWEIGSWTTSVRVLRNPLSGEAPNWGEYRGASIVRPLLDGRANFVELSVSGPAGR